MTEPGTTDSTPAGARLQFTRHWDVPAAEVWAALTAPDRLARWFGTYDGPREPGGTGLLTMTAEDGATGEPLTVVECAEGRRLSVAWGAPDHWAVDLDLAEVGGATTLVFSQVFRGAADVPDDVALGWHWYLDRLDAEVRGTAAPPAWEEFLAGTAPRYGA
ncbi:ATPase [Geodermatophilaceae bacterium NBWT11]|jgi:uncharacterized protein YndB with AHSA1/START domain|nr:ATPase [Geodermatophilaceae bacterium NBWT11]